LLRPEAVRALTDVDAIVHAGDIGTPAVLAALARIAPVTAVRGNNDRGAWAARIPCTATLAIAGARLYVLHDRHELAIDPHAAGMAAVISGHSHRPAIEERNGVLFVNPGSAGPRRFTLPVAAARLRVARGAVTGEIVLLNV
jgi:putative phosphoesterase